MNGAMEKRRSQTGTEQMGAGKKRRSGVIGKTVRVAASDAE
jgi:hypothetical protein